MRCVLSVIIQRTDGSAGCLCGFGSDVSSEDLDGMSLDDLELLRDDIRHGRGSGDGRESIRVTVRFRYAASLVKNQQRTCLVDLCVVCML